jgi:hypothetical protein
VTSDEAIGDAKESEGAALWRRTVEELVGKGASPAEAIDGANLILEAYRRQRTTEEATPRPSSEDIKTSGIRLLRRVCK